MRVAFTLIGGAGWTGGLNYLENLLSALTEYPECGVEPLLFAGEDADPAVLKRLTPYLSEAPVISRVWNSQKRARLLQLCRSIILQCDYMARQELKRKRIDVLFQHGAWYGCRLGVPTLAWIADFQHRHLPTMFSKLNRFRRDVGYWALSHCATQIMVSSEDAKRDCERFYPRSVGRVGALPFAVRTRTRVSHEDLEEVRRLYALPEKFFFLPNQLWKHKNHIAVVEALNLIKDAGKNVALVVSGNPKDARNPDHPDRILGAVKAYGLESHFIFLGLIPYAHILPLMQLSAGVINPSLFEGWSTTVEEAKGVGAPLLLSNLPIHQEQTGGEEAVFFDPRDPRGIADVLIREWQALSPGPRPEAEHLALERNRRDRARFARSFAALVTATGQIR